MDIVEFEKKNNLTFRGWYSRDGMTVTYYVVFKESMLLHEGRPTTVVGSSVKCLDDAMDDYARRISLQKLIVKPFGEQPKTIEVPRLIDGPLFDGKRWNNEGVTYEQCPPFENPNEKPRRW